MKYLWLYILGIGAIISLVIFLLTFSRDVFLIKKLKKNKWEIALNFILFSLSCLFFALSIYLFMSLKEQVGLLV